LYGQANDWQDGPLAESALQWLVDGQLVGSGEQLNIAPLAPGQHHVLLRASNSQGLVGSMEAVITVGQGAIHLPLIQR
jgi:hypothetical protein